MKHSLEDAAHIRQCSSCLAADMLISLKSLGIHADVIKGCLEIAYDSMLKAEKIYKEATDGFYDERKLQ